MSTLYVSALQNVGAPQANISLNADGSVTLPIYTSSGVAPSIFQPGTLWYDLSGPALRVRNAANTAWVPVGGTTGVTGTYTFGTSTVVITNGVITSVT